LSYSDKRLEGNIPVNESIKSELIKLLYGAVGAILGSSIVVVANLYMNNATVSATYVGIAADILKPQEKNVEFRKWAVHVINEKAPSDIKLSPELQAKLISGEVNISGFVNVKLDDVTGSANGKVGNIDVSNGTIKK